MILRPALVWYRRELRNGLEVEIDDEGRILRVGRHMGMPDLYMLSPAFVNVHSHLEYRGMIDMAKSSDYIDWIQELIGRKASQSFDDVQRDADQAALENRAAGVAWVGEHSDRPVSGKALQRAGLLGRLWQETITIQNVTESVSKLHSVRTVASQQGAWSSPHAVHTVDPDSLSTWAGKPLSIHAGESPDETRYFWDGTGPIGEMIRRFGAPEWPRGTTPIQNLHRLGLLSKNSQIVHACEATQRDIDLLAESGASVAHCPRSNQTLKCRPAPIRTMLDRGIPVGLGLDSAASSGPIDFFAEMRAAIAVSKARGEYLDSETVWNLGTTGGAASVGLDEWEIEPGNWVPLIGIEINRVCELDEILAESTPESVQWIPPFDRDLRSFGPASGKFPRAE